jgi:hypothetical protein
MSRLPYSMTAKPPILSNYTASVHSAYPGDEDDAYYEYFPLAADY